MSQCAPSVVDSRTRESCQCVALEVKVLVVGRDTGISDAVIHGRLRDLENLAGSLTLFRSIQREICRRLALSRKRPFYGRLPLFGPSLSVRNVPRFQQERNGKAKVICSGRLSVNPAVAGMC